MCNFKLQHGEMNLENVTHEEAVATLKATHDRVILVIAKMSPPIAVPSSPHPCKCVRQLTPAYAFVYRICRDLNDVCFVFFSVSLSR